MKQATGMTSTQFEQLFRDNYERLYYHAYDFVHDTDVAKDMVSDVFVNLWQSHERLDGNRVLSYLYVSVRNRCLDQLGRGKRFVPLLDGVLAEMEDFNDRDWEDYEARIRRLRQELGRLPERARHVLRLRFFEQKSNQEVADLLNVTVDGVKKIVQRAFAQLRVTLDEKMLNLVLLLILVSID